MRMAVGTDRVTSGDADFCPEGTAIVRTGSGLERKAPGRVVHYSTATGLARLFLYGFIYPVAKRALHDGPTGSSL